VWVAIDPRHVAIFGSAEQPCTDRATFRKDLSRLPGAPTFS
jgi:hypothetical protein